MTVTTVNRNPYTQFLNRSHENTIANASLSVWEYVVSASDNERLAKPTGRKTLFSAFFLKQNSTQTVLAGVSNNFGFERRMKIRQYWSFGNKSLNFAKGAFLSPIHTKPAFRQVNTSVVQ